MQIHNKNQNKNSIMQTKVYKTRVSILLILIVISVGILCQLPLIMNHAPKMAIISNSATMFFVLGFGIASIINIKYVIVNDTLRIYSFFWIHKDIKIDSIRKMEPSRSIISSPAGSLKRLAIRLPSTITNMMWCIYPLVIRRISSMRLIKEESVKNKV